MKFRSFKYYPHSRGLSVAFRNTALAPSHCAQMHGYALGVKLCFEAEELERGIVVDFGSLKSFWGLLEDQFDHKTVIAENDPDINNFLELNRKGICTLRILPHVGCESFAYYIYGSLETWLQSNGYSPRVKVAYVEVWEHEGNGASYGDFP